jgi:hypothetical protein
MAGTVSMEKIYEELKALKEDVQFIKARIMDADTIMTPKEAKRYERSMEELRQGKTRSLSAVKKKLGL